MIEGQMTEQTKAEKYGTWLRGMRGGWHLSIRGGGLKGRDTKDRKEGGEVKKNYGRKTDGRKGLGEETERREFWSEKN